MNKLVKVNNYCYPQFRFTHYYHPKNQISLKYYEYLKQFKNFLHDKLLSFLIIKQCSAVAAQKIRRGGQLLILYNNLGYDKTLVKKVIEKFANSFFKNEIKQNITILLGAALLALEKEKSISDSELDCVASEITSYYRESNKLKLTDDWENVINKNNVKIWRKSLLNTHLYEYKVCGTYLDIPARAFYDTQVDLNFRKQWDHLVICLDVIDCDQKTGTEVVRWVTHFPYPLYSREYIYVRRYKIDKERKLMVIVNRSVDGNLNIPHNENYVRVETYMSRMVIRPHTNFDENGFDYVLTYYDDPKANFPKFAYNWMANTGVPDFVDKLHDAAVLLHSMKSCNKQSLETDPLPM